MQIDKDLAYLLHCTPYRENSVLAHLLTETHGKVSFVVSGMKSTGGKSTKTSSARLGKRALLQPCRPLLIAYQLKSNLSKLTQLEAVPNHAVPDIRHFMLYQYIHELLLTALPSQLPVAEIFTAYQNSLQQLCQQRVHRALRTIEIALIDAFSSVPDLFVTQDSQQAVATHGTYFLHPEQGVFSNPPFEKTRPVSGDHLLAFAHLYQQDTIPSTSQAVVTDSASQQTEETQETLARGAQAISSVFIAQLLNGKQLKTRNIYRDLQTMQLL